MSRLSLCAAVLSFVLFFSVAFAFAIEPFECPWTAVPSGTNNPSSDGCYGGGDDAGCSPTGTDGPAYPCTADGDAEKAVAISLLQAGQDICSVADQLNAAQPSTYSSLPGDTECVCYPNGPYVGCREFYMAGPDDGSFTPANYQSVPSLWFAVSRCDPNCTDPNGCM